MSFYRSLGGMVRSHGPAHGEFGADRDRPPLTLDAAMLRRAFRTFLPYRWASLLILISIGLTSAIGLVSPLLVRAILDRAIPERRLSLLYLLVLGLVAVPLVTGLLGALQNYLFTVTATLFVLFAMDARLAVLACLIVPLFLFPLRRAGTLPGGAEAEIGRRTAQPFQQGQRVGDLPLQTLRRVSPPGIERIVWPVAEGGSVQHEGVSTRLKPSFAPVGMEGFESGADQNVSPTPVTEAEHG